MPAVLVLLAFAVSFTCLPLLLSRFGELALDRPNERSLHARPMPRTGGIAILAGAAVSLAFGVDSLWLPITLAALLAVLPFADDTIGLPAPVRLSAHLAAACVLAWYVLSPTVTDWLEGRGRAADDAVREQLKKWVPEYASSPS